MIAFGARKLREDDDGPKYLNTPETQLFKKSSVLYGADLAKRDIAQRRQAVIVEGYTDVMACHLAGVSTAVATSGTSFGDGHIKIIRRLLSDADWQRGEVIFTFDGDSAGQRAALRAFEMEEKFVTQTFVAVQQDGLDPCDLRSKQGEGAVRDLIARRVPLYEFAIRRAFAGFDLDSAEGKLAGLDAAADVIARIKDDGLRKVYTGFLDRWLGLMDEHLVLVRVNEHVRRARRPGVKPGSRGGTGAPSRPPANGRPPAAQEPASGGRAERPYDLSDPVIQAEREALKLALQRPALCGPVFDELEPGAFSAPGHAALFELIAQCGGAAGAGEGIQWAERLRSTAPTDQARAFVTQLAVEPVHAPRADGEPDARYADAVLARIGQLSVSRKIAVVKSRLQRLNPVTETAEYNRLFGDLVALEQRHKVLGERASGAL